MSTTLAPSLTQISYTWTTWKSIQQTKRFNTQYADDGLTYTIWGYDGPEVHQCSIYKGTVPDGLLAAYSQAQNDADKADFEATYKPYANRQIQRQDRSQLLTAATLTATGSSVIAGINASANYLIINIKNAPTGTTPSITFTVQDVDPIDQTTVMGSPVSFTAMTAAGTQENSFLCNSGSAKISWTITGTTPSFTGVNVSIISKDGVASGANLSTVGSATPTIAGLIGGSDGTNMRSIKMATDGTVRVDPTGTTTQPVSGIGNFTVTQATAANLNATVTGAVTSNIGTTNGLALDATLTGGTQRSKLTDGTTNVSVKAASTAAVAADPALVVSLSPNSPLLDPDTTTGGTLTASGQSVTITCPGGDSAWILGLSGTFSAGTSIVFEGTIDGTNWFALNGRQTGIVNTVLVNTISGGSGPYLFRGNTSGLSQFRARCSALQVSDSVTVSIRISSGVGATFLNASIPAGSNTIGAVLPALNSAGTTMVALNLDASGNLKVVSSGGSSASVGTLNATAPTSGDTMGGIDATGKLQAVQVDNILGQTPKQMSVASTITSPGAAARGAYAYVNAYGTLRTSTESTNLFNDNFDQGIDAVKWTTSKVSGGGAITFSAGTGNINAGTTASAYSVLTSVPTFSNYGSTFLIYATVAAVTGPTTGSYRFWGIGNSATTPTAPAALASTSTAVVDAVGFEYDIAGNFYAVIYSNTTNIYRSAALTAPTSSQSRYGFQLRADVVIFYVGTTEYPAASANYQTPSNCILPVLTLAVNGGSTLGSASQINMQALGMGDSGKNSAQLSDSTYPWRKATVDSTGALKIASSDAAISGGALPTSTSLIGGQSYKQLTNLHTDRVGNVKVGFDTLLFSEAIEGNTLNSLMWATNTSTMTITQSSTGGIFLNNNNYTVSGAYAILRSKKKFQIMNNAPIRAIFIATLNQATGTQVDLGFGSPTNGSAISVGAWFSYSSTGTLTANYNSGGGSGVITSAAITGIATGSSVIFTFWIELQDQGARFIIEDSTGLRFSDITLTYTTPTNNPTPTGTHQSIFARAYNVTSASIIAGNIIIYSATVLGVDLNTNKNWPTQMAGLGRMSVYDPVAYAQTQQLATAAAPTAGTPSNTAALYTTLGGEFIANATATSESLLSIFAYTIPAGYNFYLQGISIPPLIVSGAATATTATVVEFAVVANCASTNISTGGGQRFVIPGFFQVPVTAAIGTVWNGQQCNWSPLTPVLCTEGTVLHIAYKVIIGTATASNRNRGNVYVDGFFE